MAHAVAGAQGSTESTTGVYEDVFLSYSHKDREVVLACRDVYKSLGMRVNVDVDVLRSGERFDAALMRRIEDSDIFQLFWSRHAAGSAYVRREWEYALQCGRSEGFIRPVVWEQPPPAPPPELADLHFAYVPLPRRRTRWFGLFG